MFDARVQDRHDEYIAAEHELVLDVPGPFVAGEVDEQRAHRREALLVGDAHLVHQVRTQALPHPEGLLDQFERLLAEGPHLVRAVGHLGAERGPLVAEAVEPEQRAEHPVLEPPDHQLPVPRAVRVTAVEPADIGGPPRDSRDRHVQPGFDLGPQRRPAGRDVTGPQCRAVALAPGPCRPAQQHDFVVAPRRVQEIGLRQGSFALRPGGLHPHQTRHERPVAFGHALKATLVALTATEVALRALGPKKVGDPLPPPG